MTKKNSQNTLLYFWATLTQIMRCLPYLTLDCDVPIWVTQEKFFEHFDQEDFLCRECKVVTLSYLIDWFHTPADGIKRFHLPTFQFVAGKTQFINGRHRTAVLLSNLKSIPIAFSLINAPSKDFLARIASRPLHINEFVELPDLPIVENMSE